MKTKKNKFADELDISWDEKELAECPLATQDIKTNLANRAKAVEDADYGPANPNEPNEDYWKAKADEFQGNIPTAKKMLCGNCAAFNLKTDILDCIEKGIGSGAEEVKEAGQLGYCEIFDFKCASRRTCSAWVVGGPITDEEKELAVGDCGQEDIGTFGPNNVCAVGYGRPPLKGGYTPTRPGGKFPKDYKRPTTQKQKEQAKKPQPPRIPEKPKKEIPSSDKIKKGTAQSQAPDAKAVEWEKTIKSDKDDKKLFEDFTGSRFREINTNPEGQEGQRIISLVNSQSPQTQKTDMYRGLSLKSEEDANRFFEGLRGGQTTNRTLTSFTPDSNKAAFFSFAKTKEPVSVFMTLKSSKNLKALQGVSVESFEQEFVLTRGKRLRLIGEPRRKKNTLEFEIDVEEY